MPRRQQAKLTEYEWVEVVCVGALIAVGALGACKVFVDFVGPLLGR